MRAARIPTSTALTLILALVATASFSANSSAQLGEIAGPLNYSLYLGSTGTLNMTVFNSGGVPLNFRVIPPLMKTTIANTTKPVVTVSPSNGTLNPGQATKIAVAVTIPSAHNKPGYYWSGIVQVLEVPNTTAQGVAIIEGGVAKSVNVTALVPPFNPLEVIIPAIVIIAVVAVVVLWKKGIILKKGAAKRAAPAAKAAARRAGRKTAARRRAPARRRAARRARSPARRARARRRRR